MSQLHRCLIILIPISGMCFGFYVLGRNHEAVMRKKEFSLPNVLGHPAARRKSEFNRAADRRRMRRLVGILVLF